MLALANPQLTRISADHTEGRPYPSGPSSLEMPSQTQPEDALLISNALHKTIKLTARTDHYKYICTYPSKIQNS